MKVVFLTASTSRNAGGLFFTITNYTKALLKNGIDVTVVGLDDEFSADDRINYGNVPVVAYNPVKIPLLYTFGYSLNLEGILEQLRPDIIHLQGLWMFHSLAALRYRKKHPSSKLIIEPHGMLDPWAIKNSKWKKKLVGYWFEYENLRKADCFHALCASEQESIRKFGLTNPIVIIPNGVEISTTDINLTNRRKSILFLGRIHPKKGIEQLVEAVRIIRDSEPYLLSGWTFRIAGWDQNGHQKYLSDLVDKYSLHDYIEFIGPVFGEQKVNELTSAKAFILPSFSEGLPMSVLEAWSYGLPSIMTEHCNLPEGFKANASIKITTDAENIAKGITEFLSSSDLEINHMAENAMNLVRRQFSWDKIANNTKILYQHLYSKN